jgi:hypothetical protein
MPNDGKNPLEMAAQHSRPVLADQVDR